MELSIFFAGTSGSVPSGRRGLPALLVRRGGERILFDCGEGTQRQLVRSVGLLDITDVFITHFHADHWLGLPGMIKTFDLRERTRPLNLYGPPGLVELMRTMRVVYGRIGYELRIEELEPGKPLPRDGYQITPVPVEHGPRSRPVRAVGYVLAEDPRPGRFDVELATRLGLGAGPDFGRLQRGETVRGVAPEQVLGPERAGRKLVFSGDTRPCASLITAAHGADVLVHEATFAEEEVERASETGHSTARQAAEVAQTAGVGLLALNHLGTRYAGGELRAEARATFPRTEVPRDFDTIEIPFPERGEPLLVRWPGRGGAAGPEEAGGSPAAQRAAAAQSPGIAGDPSSPADVAPRC